MQEKIINEARKLIGNYLREIRLEKKLSIYYVAKKSGLQIGQINEIEIGELNYTFDTFLKIIHALDCYFYLENKDGKHLDFIDLVEKAMLRKKTRDN